SHAERLPAELIAAADSCGIPLSGFDLFAVASGPGSFTGLRIGIATMQGVAFVARKPMLGVSALEALVHAAVATVDLRPRSAGDRGRPGGDGGRPAGDRGRSGGDGGRLAEDGGRLAGDGGRSAGDGGGPTGTIVAAWMDAHRREVFAALYRVADAAPFDRGRL